MRRDPTYPDPSHGPSSGRILSWLALGAAAGCVGLGLAACEEFETTTDVGVDPTFSVEISEDSIRLPAGADTLPDVSVTVAVGSAHQGTLDDPRLTWTPPGYVGTDGRLRVPSPVDGLKLVAELDDEQYTASPDSVFVTTWALVSITDPSQLRLFAIGETHQLDASAEDADGTVHDDWPLSVTWTSTDAGVVEVQSDGLIEARANGTAVVYAESDFDQDSVRVEVRQRLSWLGGPSSVDALNESVTFIGYDPGDSPYHLDDVRYSSGDPTVVEVDSITGAGRTIGEGTVDIQAATPEDTCWHTVTVAQTVTDVWVDPSADTLNAVSETVQLSAVPQDRNGMAVDASVGWTSRDDAIATVDGSGLVTAQGPGTVAVVASAGSVSDSALVTVLLPVDTVVLTPNTLTFTALADTAHVLAEAFDATGYQRTDVVMAWASVDSQVVAVDSTGLMTAVANGSTQVTATAEGVTGTLDVTVSQAVDTIVVFPAVDTLVAIGDTVGLDPDPLDANGYDVPGVTLGSSSSDTLVATIGAGLVVTAIGPGTAIITFTDGTHAGTAEILVDPAVDSLAISPDSVGFDALGAASILTVEAYDSGGTLIAEPGLAWSSADTLVVTADTGVITSVGNGTATVTAAADGVSATVKATVQQVVVGVDVTPDSTTIDALGDTTRLTGAAVDANGYPVAGPELTWESTDSLVATVDSAGLVTAVTNGEAVVRATGGAGTDSAVVTVAQRVDSIAVTPDQTTFVAIGDSGEFTAALFDPLGNTVVTGVTPVWSITDTLVATLDTSTLVTVIAAGPGTTTLTAAVDSVAGTAAITVDQVAAAVVLSPDTVTLNAIGDTAVLTPTVTDENSYAIADPAMTWTSSDTLVARVDTVGRVTSVANGTAAIVAVSDAAADTAMAVVDQVEADVLVDPVPANVEMGSTIQLTAEVRDSNGVAIPGAPVTWSSADTTIATVDATGLVTGVAVGQTVVTASGSTTSGNTDVIVALPGLVENPLTVSSRAFTCDINDAGHAYCWGENHNGSLGNGTSTASASPVAVSGAIVFAAVSGDGEHACGITPQGKAYCWGGNWNGQLGDSTYTNSSTPVAVAGGLVFKQISAGEHFTCGVTVGGDGYCWGWNDRGRLGYGGYDHDRSAPTLVAGGHNFASISAGSEHACGLTVHDELYCWGSNQEGKLGDGTWSDQYAPSLVADGHLWNYVSAGHRHTCGVTTSNVGYCWGHNGQSRLGHTSNDENTPGLAVSGALTYRVIEAASQHSCAITTDDQTVCWGYNGNGRLGTGSDDWSLSSPRLVNTSLTFTHLAAGSHTCGMTAAGNTWCWGPRGAGIGDGVPGYYLEPAQIYPGVTIAHDGLGDPISDHTCHIGTDGYVYCTGENNNGQLGDGTTTDRASLTPVSSAQTFYEVDEGGWTHTCGIATSGDAYCWGGNWNGMLGDGTRQDRHTPVLVTGGHTWQTVSAANDVSCGVTTGGALYCWGANGEGQAGQSDTGQNYDTPQLVDSTRTWIDVGTGGRHTCGLTDVGDVYCWGTDNADNGCVGLLGDGNWCATYTSPNMVLGGYTFAQLDVGRNHVCAITTTGEGYCWGDNHRGQLGDGSNSNRNSPVRAGLLLFSAIDVGSNETCGSKTDGTDVCWGGNDQGELGTGAPNDASAPTVITGGVDFVEVRTGGDATCGITATNELYCWGHRGTGIFGDGWAGYATAPTPVITH